MDYLSSIEKAKIENFYKDEVLREAIRKVLLAGVYYNGVLRAGEKAEPLKNAALSRAYSSDLTNEELGADVRALAQGIQAIEMAFKKMAEIKAEPILSTDKEVNPAL